MPILSCPSLSIIVSGLEARDGGIVHAEQDSGLYAEVDDPVKKRDVNIGTPLYFVPHNPLILPLP